MANAAVVESSPYTGRGQTYNIMPIPPEPEHCLDVPAGPVRFVLESRALDAGVIGEHVAKYGSTLGLDLEMDAGASLHVFGADDGLEHLRFDCFEKQPHYHYVHQAEQLNQVVAIDDVAVDPIDWTLLCVRGRLPEMLDYAGAGELAAAVRREPQAVEAGLARVADLIGKLSPRAAAPAVAA